MNNTICVIKNTEGKEVGRIAATAPNAAQYLQTMTETHGGCSVEHEEVTDAAMMRFVSPAPSLYGFHSVEHTEVDGFPVVSGRRSTDWVAWIEGHDTTWGCGPTREEAIGDVLRTAKAINNNNNNNNS